ncbi:MAG: hypothetical protein ACREFZ_08905 [Acetobacteraceae bacterium]
MTRKDFVLLSDTLRRAHAHALEAQGEAAALGVEMAARHVASSLRVVVGPAFDSARFMADVMQAPDSRT